MGDCSMLTWRLARVTMRHMSRRVFFLSVFLVALNVIPAIGSAQTVDTSLDAEAHGLFEAGRTAFAAGRFSDALGYFERAYELSQRPQLLYNVGQCQDRMRHDAEALAAFEEFLTRVPDSPQRAEVESRITFLRQATTEHAATTTTTPTATSTDSSPPIGVVAPRVVEDVPVVEDSSSPTPSSPSGDDGPGVAPWIVLGIGGAAAVTGAVLLGLGYADIARVSDVPDGTDYATVRGADQEAPVLTGVGWALLGAGAAVAVGCIIWGVAASGHGSSETVALRVGPSSLVLMGSF